MTLFAFVQFEFTHALGPVAGRYVLENDRVLVLTVLGASPARPRRRLGRSPTVAPNTPGNVPVLLATVVDGTPFADEAAARVDVDAATAAPRVSAALVAVNRAIRAHRLAARDPYAIEVTVQDARATRIGFGTGDQVSAGTWTHAVAVEAPEPERLAHVDLLRPQERMAELLAGQRTASEGDELLLRAALDLTHGRPRAAALGLRAALDLLAWELAGDERAAEVEALAAAVEPLRRACLTDAGSDADELADLIAAAEVFVE